MKENKEIPAYGKFTVGTEFYFFDLNNLETGIHTGKVINVEYEYDPGNEEFGCGYVGPTHTWSILGECKDYREYGVLRINVSESNLCNHEDYIKQSFNKFIGVETYGSVTKIYLRISTDKNTLIKNLVEEYGYSLNNIVTKKNALLNELSIINGQETVVNNKLNYLNTLLNNE